MICSFCDTKMQMSEREHIEVNYCPQCGGIWLQRGALEGILVRSSAKVFDVQNRLGNKKSMDHDTVGISLRSSRRKRRGDRTPRVGGIREFLGNMFKFG